LGSSLFIGGPIVLATFGTHPNVWTDVSPGTHIADGQPPPFFLSYADADYPMLRDYAKTFAAQLRQAGVPVRLEELEYRDHLTEIAEAADDGDPLGQMIEEFAAHPQGIATSYAKPSATFSP
jgi:acetyl esterase/lipase